MTTIVQAQSVNNSDDYDDTQTLNIIKAKRNYYLSVFNKTNFKERYDSIEIDDNYAFCRKDNLYLIFSQKTGKLVLKNIRAYFKVGNSTKFYQLLIKNDIIWLDLNSKLNSLKPTTNLLNVVCGTVPNYKNFITQKEDSTRITFITINEGGIKTVDTTFDLTEIIGKKSIFFLNSSIQLDFDANYTYRKNLDTKVFFEKLLNGKFNIFKLEMQNPIRKTILVSDIENKYDGTNRNNYFNPFIFTQRNLYGYFPLTMTAKYIFLNPLNINFAKFMYPNGKTGWLDINGIEYFDK